MIDRRTLLLVGATAGLARPALARTWLSEDGLHQRDWFLESFLDLEEDRAAAAAKERHLAVLWGLKGCPACKRMNEVHFEDEAIVAFIRQHFEIVHLNILGDREVTDFDGRKRGEKAFAQAYAIRTTPSIQFFPRGEQGLGGRAPLAREAARMPGLLEPRPFLAMFRFVAEEAYRKEGFADWLKRQAA